MDAHHIHSEEAHGLEAKLVHQLVSGGAGVKVRPGLPDTVTSQVGHLLVWGPEFEMGIFQQAELQMAARWGWLSQGRGGELAPWETSGHVCTRFGLSPPEAGGVQYRHLAGDGQRCC